MPSCCVKGCTSRSDNNKKADGITFHLFPKNEAKRRKWARTIGRETWQPSSSSVVCSRHFHHTCFYQTSGGLVRLLQGSLPSQCVTRSVQVMHKNVGTSVERILKVKNDLSDKLSVLRTPVVTEEDPPEAHRLAAEVRRLLLACKRQRQTIRVLQRRLRKGQAAEHGCLSVVLSTSPQVTT